MDTLYPAINGAALPTLLPIDRSRTVGGLWRRLAAIFIDTVAVGIAVNLLAFPFFNTLSRIGAWGGLIGFCLSFPYFAVLNSRIGDGQTIGKRWMHIQVVDSAGKTISFARSCLRYFVLAFLFFFDEVSLPASVTPQFLQSFISTLVFIIGAATVYLVLFNRHTRQGVHDLAAKSLVADAFEIGEVKTRPIWKGHWIILGSLLGVYFVCALWSNSLFGDKFSQYSDILPRIESVDHVYAAGLSDLTWHSFGTEGSKRILVVSVRWSGSSESEEAAADQIARLILDRVSNADNRDSIRIIFDRGYNLGIASMHMNKAFEHTPGEWRTRLGVPSQTPSNQL